MGGRRGRKPGLRGTGACATVPGDEGRREGLIVRFRWECLAMGWDGRKTFPSRVGGRGLASPAGGMAAAPRGMPQVRGVHFFVLARMDAKNGAAVCLFIT